MLLYTHKMNDTKKYALVTGASTGIGRATAVALGQAGFTVGLIARSKSGLKSTLGEIGKVGGVGKIFPLNLRNISGIYSLTKKIKREWKEIHIIVNVAGVYHDASKAFYDRPFEKYSTEEILNIYEVGTNGTTFLTHAILPIMKKDSHVISLSGTFENGNSGWLPYYVSKRAIEDFTVGLAQELITQGIFVNCISPSDTATETYKKFFPQYIHEALNPEVIGKFIVQLVTSPHPPTGKVFILKKDTIPYEAFHV